jgi:hypothetical protein
VGADYFSFGNSFEWSEAKRSAFIEAASALFVAKMTYPGASGEVFTCVDLAWQRAAAAVNARCPGEWPHGIGPFGGLDLIAGRKPDISFPILLALHALAETYPDRGKMLVDAIYRSIRECEVRRLWLHDLHFQGRGRPCDKWRTCDADRVPRQINTEIVRLGRALSDAGVVLTLFQVPTVSVTSGHRGPAEAMPYEG